MRLSRWEAGWNIWDLLSHLRENRAISSGSLYRGHGNSSWKLIPNLYRRDIRIYGSQSLEDRYLIAENRMIESFYDKALLLLPQFSRSPLIDRVICQHYGVPTQLLDWTLDPFIGLWFAVQDGKDDADGAFFYINPLSTIDVRHNLQLPFRGKVAKIFPPVLDDRVRTQKSAFTLHSFGGDLAFVPLDDRALKVSVFPAGTDPADEVDFIGKVIIPNSKKVQIKGDLLELGVDSSLLFPGLQGIGHRILDMANLKNYGGDGRF